MITIKFNNWDKYNKRQKDIKNPFWFSMSNNFFYDPEFYDFSAEEKCTFFYLLAEASRNGCYGEFNTTETHYSRITGYSKQTLYKTLDKLLKIKVAAVSRQDGGVNPASTEQNKTEQDNIKYMSDFEKSDAFDFEEIYKAYPRRLGDMKKGGGINKLKRLIKTQTDFDDALNAVKRYNQYCIETKKVKTELVKMFSSFFDANGDWREWITFTADKPKSSMDAWLEKYKDEA
ncbi:MAG TPA: hypothetical protein PK522_00850 [Nitrosomonas sp.]|nr:hypothetical protein [Nitrosomonas sp.]